MRRTLASIVFFITGLLSNQTVLAAQCVWGSPETSDMMPSVPNGVALKSREISIGQPLDLAMAAIRREFPTQGPAQREWGIEVDGRCSLKFIARIDVHSRVDGKVEELRAEFGSPAMGSQLLAFERGIEHNYSEEYPLIDEIMNQLYGRFGDPSASKETRDYYFVYKDQRKIKFDLELRGGSHPCAEASNSNLTIYESMKYNQCDFIVHVNFNLLNSGDNSTLQRYKEVKIRYLDLTRARIDADIRDRRATKIKEEFAAESRKRPPKDRI